VRLPFRNWLEYIIAARFPNGGIIYGYNWCERQHFGNCKGSSSRPWKSGTSKPRSVEARDDRFITRFHTCGSTKANMVEKTAQLIKWKGKLKGILCNSWRIQSIRELRVFYELSEMPYSSVVLNIFYKTPPLQDFFFRSITSHLLRSSLLR